MRNGKLDRTITIGTITDGVPLPDGTPTETLAVFATVRAQKVEASTEEYLRGYGETDNTVIIFRTHFIDGVTTKHVVQFEGRTLNIRETKEIGRRKGLEIRCEEVRS